MSDCGNCSCTDKNQCVKKGSAAEVVETDKSYKETEVMMDAPVATEHDDKSKCGSSCTYPNCNCGH